MEHFVGLDVSQEMTHLCVIDGQGKTVWQGRCLSTPEAIAGTIKSALPRPCTMTVPSAEVEFADFCIPPRTADSVTVFFHHDSGELMVRVWEYAMEGESEIDTYAQLCA